jgi:hypothetical protein
MTVPTGLIGRPGARRAATGRTRDAGDPGVVAPPVEPVESSPLRVGPGAAPGACPLLWSDPVDAWDVVFDAGSPPPVDGPWWWWPVLGRLGDVTVIVTGRDSPSEPSGALACTVTDHTPVSAAGYA